MADTKAPAQASTEAGAEVKGAEPTKAPPAEAVAAAQAAATKAAEQAPPTPPAVDLEKVKADTVADYAKKQEEFLHAEQAKWRSETEADPEVGGEAAKRFDLAKSPSMRKFGSPELERFLRDTGFADHKLVRQFIARADKAMTPERAVFGTVGGSATPTNLAEALYGGKKK